jgi:hypothetical protein
MPFRLAQDGDGLMNNAAETRANLEAKLGHARRLLQQILDLKTAESLKAFIADLENRLRNMDPG